MGVDALRAAGADGVVVVGGDEPLLSALGLPVVPDPHPDEGPLGGILTAFAATSADLVVVMACDMPGVGPEVPAALVAALAEAPDAGVAVAVVGDREQPLTACWRRSSALPVLRSAFAAGERAPRSVLPMLAPVRVAGLPSGVSWSTSTRPEDLRRYADRSPTPGPEEEAPL